MQFEIDFIEWNDREAAIRELQRIAAALGQNTLSGRDIDTHGRISAVGVKKRFGTLRQALQAAGLTPRKFTKPTDQELISMLIELWTQTFEKFGRSPFRRELQAFGFPLCPDTFTRRFGTWNNALRAAADSMRPGGIFADAAERVVTPPARPVTTAAHRRKSISIRKRFLVLKRDRYRCRLCKRSGVELEVDHRVPLAQGGTDALDNLQTLCADCNGGKSDSSE